MVYITSDLFSPTTTHNREHPSLSTPWPDMANTQHPAGLGKRKRHNAEEGPSTYESLPAPIRGSNPDPRVGSKHQSPHWLPPPGREPARPHSLANASPFDRNNTLSYERLVSTSNKPVSARRPTKQLKRLSAKAMLVKSTSHLMDVEVELPSNSQYTDTPPCAVSDLRPCHACNLAPKRRKDLVNYLDCKRCDGRTCYICARECVGGCGKAICKKCVVEVGQEGVPWCLDCYSRQLNS